ncbi:relaxase/mobilization nuclease domain-containing protein [Tolypothrix bouteillei VB521301_2]|uniref:relaxase/mobilization nuclease domain-containing protein n=1 Tax=Tolypothrix bouteillei TaxID=1246981 RepID=UPI0038B654A8
MMGTSPHQFNEQFLSTKYSNKAVKRQCAHLIISIAHRPDYHEHLSDSQYSYVAKDYLKDMGYLPKDESLHATSQYVVVRHSDRNHEHLHIIASRIRLDGSLVNDSYDYFNSQVSTRRIADQLGLEVTPTTNEAVALKLEQEYGITATTSPNRSKSIKAVNSKHKTPTSKEMIREAMGKHKDSPSVLILLSNGWRKTILQYYPR